MTGEPLTITLYGARRRSVAHRLAYDFAYLSIDRVVTVRGAPLFPPEREAAWRDLRSALLSALPPTFDQAEFPAVPEPTWPLRYRREDLTRNQTARRGAKPVPTYSSQATSVAATDWAAAFMKIIGLDE